MKKFFLLMQTSVLALAEAAPAAARPNEGLTPFIPLLLIFAVFYFMILRPQQRKQKEHQKFLTELKRGDMVITQSGIIGTVKTVSDRFVTLEVDENVNLKILKSQVLESAASWKEAKAVGSTKEATS